MNQLDNLTVSNLSVNGPLSVYGATSLSGTISGSTVFTDDITLGSHTFKAEQLGQLFNLLLSQYPELSL